MKKELTAFILILALIGSMFSTFSVQAATVVSANHARSNVMNNPYYEEVSSMATEVSANLGNETWSRYCYDSLMAAVFGDAYQTPKPGLRRPVDHGKTATLITYLSQKEYEEINQISTALWYIGADIKHIRYHFSDNRTYPYEAVYSTYHIDVNENGINETAYQNLKTLSSIYKETSAAMAGMDDRTKVRYLNDYLCNLLTVHRRASLEEDYASVGVVLNVLGESKKAVCNAYTGLFFLLGTSNGLQVGTDSHDLGDGWSHILNTVTIDQNLYYVDVQTNDKLGHDVTFLSTDCHVSPHNAVLQS